eukprot:4126298-Pyramimonas_sp.AAC.1
MFWPSWTCVATTPLPRLSIQQPCRDLVEVLQPLSDAQDQRDARDVAHHGVPRALDEALQVPAEVVDGALRAARLGSRGLPGPRRVRVEAVEE